MSILENVNYGLIFGFIGIAVFSGVFLSAWTWAATSKRYSKYRIRPPEGNDPLEGLNRYKEVLKAVLVDATIYIAYLFLAYEWLIKESSTGWLTILVQVLAVMTIYDFMLYWVHRAMHHRFFMKHVHGFHHRVIFPRGIDDFYKHPLDSLWVISLFFLSTAIVGPLSTTGFVATLFVFAFLNNCQHVGMTIPHPLFAVINDVARRHELHHNEDSSSNYALIFPFWDWMFGTIRK